MESINTA